MYLTLNLARVLAYKEQGLILSKKEGGEWADQHLPKAYRELVEMALKEYTQGIPISCDPEQAGKYARYMLDRIGLGRE